jgi:hypothetical protein
MSLIDDLIAKVKSIHEIAPPQTLFVREVLQGLPEASEPISRLHGFPVRVSKLLPNTVKDKDGNEVELIGILMSDNLGSLIDMSVDEAAKRMVFLTGNIVKKKDG